MDAVRPGVLFNYVGVSTIDGDYLTKVMSSLALRQPQPPVTQANLNKRGFLSFVFDGRFKLARFYAPAAFNTPQTLEEILKNNDVQLFDLESDPEEMHNLALEPEKNRGDDPADERPAEPISWQGKSESMTGAFSHKTFARNDSPRCHRRLMEFRPPSSGPCPLKRGFSDAGKTSLSTC